MPASVRTQTVNKEKDMLPIRGNLKKRLNKGDVVIGPFVITPSPTLVDALGYSGMDFCIIDTEHGPISMETASDLVIAAHGIGLGAIVRVGGNEEWPILRSLDIGADGVQVPQINSADEAHALVRSAKYAPRGDRGLSIFTRAGHYFKEDGRNHTDRQNEETMIVAHIEGKRGLDNLEQIMQEDGIDVLFLGPYDISQSLGMPGDVRNSTVENAISQAVSKARKANRSVGSYAKDVEMGKWLIGLGVQYLAINVDATIYMQACEAIVTSLRS